ncbi:NADPH:quinone reductase [Cohaesibacter sp. ES.047]|uniref:zinc-binding dehydrogenase n=1 Tax=Cohaesibacter sp. ES.047 TaxID=1798205 RepID=UPI000BB6A2F1|nr:zinc-binding dehydrogenase [Cohaesibacter sp. ES.047]SNY92000.1 NADPH:quinone reductase [Cohaesibacter sp. ES.047]
MKAAVHDQFGNPADVLEPRDVDLSTPGEGEVRIKTILSPIHNHDLWTIRGDYGYKPPLPEAIGGSEAVGTIEAVGQGVDDAMIGRRVAIAGVHGSWAEYFIAPTAGLLPLPEQISDEQGAQLIAMPFSAISLLQTLQAKPGEWIVQTASNGAVGRIMVGLTKARGIHLLNLVRRPEAAEELREAGIENVLSTSVEGWKDDARALVGDGRITSAIDSVGGAISADLIDLLSADGELVIFGSATGEPMKLGSGPLIMKQIVIKGFWGAQVSANMAPDLRKDLISELVKLALQGDLPLETGGIYALDQAKEAMTAALTPGRAGKILLKP